MRQGEKLAKERIDASQHFTEPPPRYTEATLVKRMEELGIGRPSTYASTIAVLKDRDYVRIEKKRLFPEDKGRIVTAFLEVVLRQIRRLRFHRRSRREARQGLEQRDRLEGAAARLLERFLRRHRRHQGPRHAAGARQPERASGPAYLSLLAARASTRASARSAARANCRSSSANTAPSSAARAIPSASTRAFWRRRARRPSEGDRPGVRVLGEDPVDRRRDHFAQRALRRIHPAGRGREAQALVAAEGLERRRRDARKGAQAARPAARSGAPSDQRRADPRRHRPLRVLCAARQDLRQSRPRRRRAGDRRQPGDRSHRRQGERRRRLALRRAARGANSASIRRAARSA